jgi:quinol monooxygenase YgiN
MTTSSELSREAVVRVDRFVVRERAESFEETLEALAAGLRARDGFRAQRLLQSIRQPELYINILEWADEAGLARAMTAPEPAGLLARAVALAASAEAATGGTALAAVPIGEG